MVNRIRKFLMAVDVTSPDFDLGGGAPTLVRSLAAHADFVRKASGASLTLMTVLDGPDIDEGLLDLAKQRLEQEVVPLLDAPPDHIVVRTGKPARRIIDQVQAAEIELVMVASRKATLLQKTTVGSLGMALLRKCPCPVWVAPRRPPADGFTVISAVALHDLTEEVLRVSARFVSELGGSWHVLHVPEYPLEGGMRLRCTPAEDVEAYEREVRDGAWEALHRLVDPLAEEVGVTPKLWMSEGRPSEQVILATRELEADLVVMGTIGRGGLAGMVIGNTAERVFRQIECSLLAVKPDDFLDLDGGDEG